MLGEKEHQDECEGYGDRAEQKRGADRVPVRSDDD
jgi:hypothetical protein